MIGTDSERGIRSKATGLETVPVSNWQYYSADNVWTDDTLLTVKGNIKC